MTISFVIGLSAVMSGSIRVTRFSNSIAGRPNKGPCKFLTIKCLHMNSYLPFKADRETCQKLKEGWSLALLGL